MNEPTLTDDTPVSPLPRFHHPDHGELEIYGFDVRSRLCRSVSNGTEYRIGTRVVNRLRSADARTLPIPFNETETRTAEKLPEMVSQILAAVEDDITREQLALEVWRVADRYCPGGRQPSTVEPAVVEVEP